MKRIIVNLGKKNRTFRKLTRFILLQVKRFKYLFFYFNKVDEKMILFETFGGRNYSCNPKALYEYIISDKRFKDYTFIWAFKNDLKYQNMFDARTIVIKSKSKEYYKFLSKSKYWIVNSLIEPGVIKKKNQIYIQCWHGTPLKKLRYDIKFDGVLNTTKEIKKRNDLDTKKIDYFLSPSKYCTEKFTSAFNLKGLNKENIIIEQGYPRNDYLINYNKKDILKIKNNLNIPKNKKVILYAPTFRDNQHTSGAGYTYNLEIDFNKMKKELEKEYIILFRTHYFISNSFNFENYRGFIYNVSDYDDINELYIISDILITDYSSVLFDFANLNKPMLFYMYDLDEYKNKVRGFYIDLNMLPGPIVEKEKDLIKEIKNIDNYEEKYNKKYIKFNKKFNYLDDGKVSKKVVEVVFNEKIKKN